MEDKKGRQPDTAADKKIKSDFGTKVNDLMEKRGIKPSRLPDVLEAAGVEVTLATTKKWRGGAAIPGKPSDLVALAGVLDCDIDYLYGRSSKASRDQEAAAEYTGMSTAAVETVRYMDPATRAALESLIVAGAVLESPELRPLFQDPEGNEGSSDAYYSGLVSPPLPAMGAAAKACESFLRELAGVLEKRAEIGAQANELETALACCEGPGSGADVNLRNAAQLLRIRIEKQAAERAKLIRAFSEYIDALFPEVSEDQEILQAAEARLRPLPPVEFMD